MTNKSIFAGTLSLMPPPLVEIIISKKLQRKIVQHGLKLTTKLGLDHHPPTTTNFSKGSRLGRRLRFLYVGFYKA